MSDAPLPTTTVALPTAITPDWSNRRKIIFASLQFCAAMAGLIIVTSCLLLVAGVFYKFAADSALLNLLDSALYTLAFVATSIIGSYVFGVNFDAANSRQHISTWVAATTGTTGTTPAGPPTSALRVARSKIETSNSD